ncbi:inverse autotransporter beta domain-containing protein, partial [Thorsellia anophelis]
ANSQQPTANSQQPTAYNVTKTTSLSEIVSLTGTSLDILTKINPSLQDSQSRIEIGSTILLPYSVPPQLVYELLTPKNNSLIGVNALPSLSTSEIANSQDDTSSIAEIALRSTPIESLISSNTEENIATLAQGAATTNWEELSAEQLKNEAENWAKSQVKSQIFTPVQNFTESLLGKFGKVEVNISVNEDGNLEGSQFSLLSPLIDKESNLFFSQVGIHGQNSGGESRTIGNFGFGYRYDQNDYLIGGNAFIDHDFTGSNTRLGIGTELWFDYLKLATNYYAPISDWKDSDVLAKFEERPAQGFDIRAKGYLPSYPHIGGNLIFEQYYGDEVALFSLEERQTNPYAYTFGLDYTPVPLFTLSASHRQGSNSMNDSKIDATINLQLGTPIDEQLDPENVSLTRSLKGSRYDIVDRNYDIIFEYREKQQMKVELSGDPTVFFNTDYSFDSKIISTYPVSSIDWQTGIDFLTPIQDPSNPNKWIIPKADLNSGRTYYIQMHIKDEQGRAVSSNILTVSVVTLGRAVIEPNPITNDELLSNFPISGLNNSNTSLALADPTQDAAEFIAYAELDNTDDLKGLEAIDGKWRIEPIIQFHDADGKVHKPNDSNDPFSQIIRLASVDKIINEQGDWEGKWNIKVTSNGAALKVKVVVIYPGLNPAFSYAHFLFEYEPGELTVNLYDMGPRGDGYSGNPKGRKLTLTTDIYGNGADPIKPDTYYRVEVVPTSFLNSNNQTIVDVTSLYINSVMWRYWDPRVEVITQDTIPVIERCNGYAMFSTQVNNIQNNEFTDELNLVETAGKVENEQGLLLAVQIDTAQKELDPTKQRPTIGDASKCADFNYFSGN